MAVCLHLARRARSMGRTSRCVAMGCFLITPNYSPCPSVASVPVASYATAAVKSGSGGTHWKVERVLSVAMVGLIPTAFIYPCPVVDYGLAIALPLHGHWGMESVVEDYVPPGMKKLAYPLLYCISLGTFAALMYLNYADVGICKAVQMIWSLK